VDTLVVVVITTALLLDFTNGFHDTANARPGRRLNPEHEGGHR